MEKKPVIIFDFDGVLIDSMVIKEDGFRYIFRDYNDENVNRLITYHHQQGGLNRRNKIKYFYNELVSNPDELSKSKMEFLLDSFSAFVVEKQKNGDRYNKELIQWIKKKEQSFLFFIVSGADQSEVRELANHMGIDRFFQNILGAPEYKENNINNIIIDEKLKDRIKIVIGDSINDLEAAYTNDIYFVAYNNIELKKYCKYYIDDVKYIDDVLKSLLITK